MEASVEAAAVSQRYEAIFRAIGRRLRPSTFACVAAVIGTTIVWTAVTPWLAVALRGLGPTLSLALIIGGFAVAVVVIPTGVQLLVLSNEDLALVEGFNAYAMLDLEHAPVRSRLLRWHQRNAKSALKWVLTHDTDEPHRVRALVWAGRVDEAASTIGAMATDHPEQRFHREISIALLAFVKGEESSLADAYREFESIPPGLERDYAALVIAFESSRRLLALGEDWRKPLIEARRQFQRLPKGASYWDRVRAGLPFVAGAILVGVVIGFFI
jgi:hypothetical protein